MWWLTALSLAHAGPWRVLETEHTEILWAEGDAPDAGQAARAAETAWEELYPGQTGKVTLVLAAEAPPLAGSARWVPLDGSPLDAAVFAAIAGVTPRARPLLRIEGIATAGESHAAGAGHTAALVELDLTRRPWGWWGGGWGRYRALQAGMAPLRAEERAGACAGQPLSEPGVGALFLEWVRAERGESALLALGVAAEAGEPYEHAMREVFSLSSEVTLERWRDSLGCPSPVGVAILPGTAVRAAGDWLAVESDGEVTVYVRGAPSYHIKGALLDLAPHKVLLREGNHLVVAELLDGEVERTTLPSEARFAALQNDAVIAVTEEATLTRWEPAPVELARWSEGTRILGIDATDDRLIVSLERRGQVDLWALADSTWTRLTDSAAREVAPRVDDERNVWFSADEGGFPKIYRLDEYDALPHAASASEASVAKGQLYYAGGDGQIYRSPANVGEPHDLGVCGGDCAEPGSYFTWRPVDLGAAERSPRYRPLRELAWSGVPVLVVGVHGVGAGLSVEAEDPLRQREVSATAVLGRQARYQAHFRMGHLRLDGARREHAMVWRQATPNADNTALEYGAMQRYTLWEDRFTAAFGSDRFSLVGGVEAAGLRSDAAVPLARAALADAVWDPGCADQRGHVEIGYRDILESPQNREGGQLYGSYARAFGSWTGRVQTSGLEHLEWGLYGGAISKDAPSILEFRLGDQPGVGPLADHAPLYGYASGTINGETFAVARAAWTVSISQRLEIALQAGLGQAWSFNDGATEGLNEGLTLSTLRAVSGASSAVLTEAGVELRATPTLSGVPFPAFVRLTRPGQTSASFQNNLGTEAGLEPLYFTLSPDASMRAFFVQEPAWRLAIGLGKSW